MSDDFLKIFHLRPYPIATWPSAIRALLTITAIIGSLVFAACILAICVLLVRLGWDALGAPTPSYQEAARNFLFAFASAFGAPFLVWRTWVAHKQAKAAAEQARVAAENHITSIFAKSIELMGQVRDLITNGPEGTPVTVSSPNIEARLGALYSLERLLVESPRDQRAILETLCAYVRENSPLDTPEKEATSLFSRGQTPPSPTRRADVQAALTVIGRRSAFVQARAHQEGWRLDFRNSNLIAYDFSKLNFDRADFTDSFLNSADMAHASFAHSEFYRTFIRGAKMQSANFRSSIFTNCHFDKSEVEKTDFTLATFQDADIRDANVTSTFIEGANFEKAFGDYSVKFAVESLLKDGPNFHNSNELLKTAEFFKKASFDQNTVVSQAVADAIRLMTPSKQP